jgi:hypothetical protein
VSDWHNNTGVIRQAKEREMGVILIRPLTSGVFQPLMVEAFPETEVLEVHVAGGNDRSKPRALPRGAGTIRTSDPAVMRLNPVPVPRTQKRRSRERVSGSGGRIRGFRVPRDL